MHLKRSFEVHVVFRENIRFFGKKNKSEKKIKMNGKKLNATQRDFMLSVFAFFVFGWRDGKNGLECSVEASK